MMDLELNEYLEAFDSPSSDGLTFFDKVTSEAAVYEPYRNQLKSDLEVLSGENVEYSDDPCPACGMKTVREFAVQLRSADEGMSTISDCGTCGRRARLS